MRVFVAVELSEEVRESVGRWVSELRRLGAKVSWVAAENMHLTLVFLGEVSGDRLGVVEAIVCEEALATPGFSMEGVGAGTFGSERAPRVVWAGVEAPPPLADVQGRLTRRLADKGFGVDLRAFRAHLTVGRVRGREGVAALTSAVASATHKRFGTAEVRRLVLMQSHLGAGGARYSIVRTFGLMNEE